MSSLARDIGSEDLKIQELVKLLQEDKFLIPTFQREFVWEPVNILKLWDSIYRFYPIGSILYWETDSYLHTHRRIGGFIFPHDEDAVRKFKEWKYILDGQQRATSLLVSLAGGRGRVADDSDFDYTLYFDATATDAPDSGRTHFFFAGDLAERKKTTPAPFLIRVRDVPEWSFTFYKEISAVAGFNADIEQNLQQLSRMFTDYKIPVTRIKGVEVNEVCDIFERINQEGKRLDPVDIIVARTYRNEDSAGGRLGFYLRDNLNALKNVLIEQGNRFQHLEDLSAIQMVALCLRKTSKLPRNPFGITPKALDNLKAEHFEENWAECQKSMLQTVKFLADLRIHGPDMLPGVYLVLPICSYLHRNPRPRLDTARQWFWRNAFAPDLSGNSTEVYRHCEEFFGRLERGEDAQIPPLTISKRRLIQTSYYFRNTLSRAVLALLANQTPLDFSDPRAVVLDNVYLLLSQAPNLHHIYPQNFLKSIPNRPSDIDPDSLMNICFIRARTNIQIGDKNPLVYFRDFAGVRDFNRILESHLIPRRFIERNAFTVDDYREFLNARAELLCDRLVKDLPDVAITVTE
jgi:hypothetical protein